MPQNTGKQDDISCRYSLHTRRTQGLSRIRDLCEANDRMLGQTPEQRKMLNDYKDLSEPMGSWENEGGSV